MLSKVALVFFIVLIAVFSAEENAVRSKRQACSCLQKSCQCYQIIFQMRCSCPRVVLPCPCSAPYYRPGPVIYIPSYSCQSHCNNVCQRQCVIGQCVPVCWNTCRSAC